MSELRKDRKPFVLDPRGVAPRYVVEQNESSAYVLINQFTCESVVIGDTPPFLDLKLQMAITKLKQMEKETNV